MRVRSIEKNIINTYNKSAPNIVHLKHGMECIDQGRVASMRVKKRREEIEREREGEYDKRHNVL